MKIIFLDIDGVLNCASTSNPRKFPYVVDEKLLRLLLHLRERRYDPVGLLAAKHFGIPFIDVTPDMPDTPRREEILSWLGAKKDVTRYAVIDDEDDGLDELPLFQPSSETGITDPIAHGVADYLNGKTDKDMRCSAVKRLVQNVRAIVRGHDG